MDVNTQKIKELLNTASIKHSFARYDPEITTGAEAAAQVGLPEKQMVKSLVVRSDAGFMLFLVPLSGKINFEKVGRKLGTKTSLASKEEAEQVTGYNVGSVCPFKLKINIPVYMDTSILEFSEVGVGSGVKGVEVLLKPEDLKRAASAKVLDLT